MPGVVVLGILMVACLYGTGSEAVSSGELLLFNNATASIEARTRAGAPDGQVALGSPGATVLPGAVTPDGMLALNPTVGALSSQGGAVRMPSLVVTSLEAAQRKVAARASVPIPAGLSGCTFDAELTLQGGVLIAAGPPAAGGQQYPVVLVLRCLSPEGICTDSYLAVYNYSTATRALRFVRKAHLQTLRSFANFAGSPGPACTNQPPDFGGGLYQPVTVLYADKPYIIATEQDGTHPTAFGVAALFSLEGSGLAQRGASGAFSGVNSASCSNFVWLHNGSAADAEDPRLAASCFLKGPGRTVVVHTSENLGDHLNFANVIATAHFDYLSIAAAPGSTSLFTLTQDEPAGPLLSIDRVVISLGQPLQEQHLFQVQGNYTSIAYIP